MKDQTTHGGRVWVTMAETNMLQRWTISNRPKSNQMEALSLPKERSGFGRERRNIVLNRRGSIGPLPTARHMRLHTSQTCGFAVLQTALHLPQPTSSHTDLSFAQHARPRTAQGLTTTFPTLT